MSTPFRGGLTGIGGRTVTGATVAGSTEVAGATRLSPAVTAALARDVVIDLETEPTRATIVRGGLEVETPVVNAARAASILENFAPIIRQQEPRAVRQSIAAGTIVTRGTAIDIDLLEPARVTLGIFEGIHTDLRAVNVTALTTLLNDPEVNTAISKPATSLTDAEKQNLSAKLATANVTVDDTVADRSLSAAIAGLKTAKAFS